MRRVGFPRRPWLVDALTGAALAVGVLQIHLTWIIVRHRDAIATDPGLMVGIALVVGVHALAGLLAGWVLGGVFRRALPHVRASLRSLPKMVSVYAVLLVIATTLGNVALLSRLPRQLGPRQVTAAAVAPAPTDSRPNVVLLVADSLRRDVFDDPKDAEHLAPHLAHFARGAIDYTQHQAVSSWTPPSMAGMLTGQYPGTLGAHEGTLPADAMTLAEVLHGAGYETVGISDNYLTHPTFGFAQGHDYYWQENNCILFADLWFAERYLPRLHQWLVRRLELQYRGAPVVNDQVERWFQGRDRSRPFYLMVHYMDTHYPYVVYEDEPDNVSKLAPASTFEPYYRVMLGARGRRKPPFADLTLAAERIENFELRYRGSLQYVDRHVGRLFELLEEAGEWDETLVIFTADHGEEFFEHSYLGHGRSMYQESTRVPLMVKWPEAAGVGPAVIEDPVSMLQIMPSILEAVRIEPPSSTLLPPLPTTPGQEPRGVFGEFSRAGIRIYSARFGEHKLLHSTRPNGRQIDEYYHLGADPAEQTNLVWEDQGAPEPATSEFTRFRTHLEELGRSDPAPTEERLRQLKALGYVQ